MEYQYTALQMRNGEIWDSLDDLTLPPLDRELLIEELVRNTMELLRIEEEEMYSYETIGTDEYDREYVVANEDFDLAGEV